MKSGIHFVTLSLLMFSMAVNAASWWESGRQLLESATGTSTETSSASLNNLSVEEIAAGLKDALKVGTGKVVSQLGANDGFLADEQIHIPLPAQIQQAKALLEKVGMGASLWNWKHGLTELPKPRRQRPRHCFWMPSAR